MAYIYQYHLRDLYLRINTSLNEYFDNIHLVIKEIFNLNLKDYIIGKEYFEFKIYKTVARELLQEMGRRLKLYRSQRVWVC